MLDPKKLNHITYDLEVYRNVFTCVIYSSEYNEYLIYEVSKRKNEFKAFMEAMETFAGDNTSMVGYNNLGYDYPVLHCLIKLGRQDPDAKWKTVTKTARDKSDQIIHGHWEDRFRHIIWERDQIIPQIDLYKIHHFDNIARATSLKALEFARRSKDVGDLPFDPDHLLEEDEIDELLRYNKHDVSETYGFYIDTLPAIEFRQEMATVIGKNITNHNDGKIGNDYFIKELEDSLGKEACFEWIDKKRKPKQTPRKHIVIDELIFDYVTFNQPCFKEVVNWLRRQTITETKGSLTELDADSLEGLAFYSGLNKKKGKIKNLNCIHKGIRFDFGTGGLHASIESGTYEADDEYAIIDLDVTSYYPSLSIENTVYPKHLSAEFCNVYEKLKKRRISYAKGTPENSVLKLALNVVYGNSNNQYSCFFDPLYTMTITINGQLSLAMFAEWVMDIKGLQFLQANTDGITVRIPRKKLKKLNKLRKKWEKLTKLDLEEVEYSRMFIRDCNSYIGEYLDGSVKRKGAYEHDLEWHKNHSMKVVAKAAEAHLLHGKNVEEFIKNHDDPFDFYIMGKCDRGANLILRTEDGDEPLQRTNRYYASTSGGEIIKVMPPLAGKMTTALFTELRRLGVELDDSIVGFISDKMNKKEKVKWKRIKQGVTVRASDDMGRVRKYAALDKETRLDMAMKLFQPKTRYNGICVDSLVTIHNTVEKMTDVNYDYYINETNKLIEPLQ